MKQKLLKTWLMLCLLLVGAGTSWAKDVTIASWGKVQFAANTAVAASSGVTGYASITLTSSKAISTSGAGNAYYGSSAGGATITMANVPTDYKIKNVTFYSRASGSGNMEVSYSTDNGSTWTSASRVSLSGTEGKKTVTFSSTPSGVNKIKFVHSASSGSLYFGTIVLTGEKLSTDPYTVTFNVGSNGSFATGEIFTNGNQRIETSAGAGVTLPNATANEGWAFQGWSTSSTPSSANAGKAGDTYKPSANTTLYAYYKVIPVAPTFSSAGSVEKGTTVTFSSTTDGCTYRYTTDGSDPTASTGTEASSFVVNEAANLKVVAVKDGIASAISSASYTVATHTATFHINGNETNEQVAKGDAIPFPADPEVDGVKFMGWTSDPITGTQKDAPSFVNTATETMGTDNATYYAVFATQNGAPAAETKTQTLEYDTWTYSGSTTNKNGYRLFHTGSYIESASFDRSKLSKVIVYGGTFGGDSYKNLTIGDGANTWKSVTVSGSSQTGTNTYTNGTALSGTGTIRITSNSGNNSGTGTGVRISKIEIYTMEGSYTYSDYCTTITSKQTPTLSFANPTYNATVGEDFTAPTLTKTDGITVTYSSSVTSVATVDSESGAVTLVAPGTTTITASFAGDETYKAASASYTLNVSAAKHTVTIETPENGTITVKDGETAISNGAQVAEGTTITLASTPNPGYKAASTPFVVTYEDGDKVSVSTADGKYSFTMPEKNVTITAHFSRVYTIAAGSFEHGEITAIKDKDGAAITETSYHSKVVVEASSTDEHWTLDGMYYVKEGSEEQVGIDENEGVYSFTMPQCNITVYATYTEAAKYNVAWVVNGRKANTEEVYDDVAVSAPSVSTINGKVFRGWVEAEILTPTNTEPSFVNVDNLTVSEDKTYYAVFATSEGEAATKYVKVTAVDQLANKNKIVLIHNSSKNVLTHENNAISAVSATNASITVTNSEIDIPNEKYIWNLTGDAENGYHLSDGTNYAGLINLPATDKTGNNEDLALTNSNIDWEIGAHTTNGMFYLKNLGDETKDITLGCQSTKFNVYTSNDASSSSSSSFILYVPNGATSYSDFTTAPLGTGSITVSGGGYDTPTNAYYATYYTDHCVTVPEGCEAASVNVEENKMLLTYTWTAGKVIPANTGVVIKASVAATYTYHIGAQGDATGVEDPNYLYGSTTTRLTVAPETGAYKFYKLAKSGDYVGFYYGAAEGAAFNTGANKAYLALPVSLANQVKGFAFSDADDATAIFDVANDDNTEQTIYNLNGQRVNKAKKGIYIVNGKKVMFK